MTNIINIFLYLITIWCGFLYFSTKFSIFNVIFGIILALFISFMSYYLKIIHKKSELLYLSLGFYKYFIWVFISNFFGAIILQIRIFFKPELIDLKTFRIVVNKGQDIKNINLFKFVINFMPAYNISEINDNEITITALNEDFSERFLASKIFKDLRNINDDSLV